MNRRSALLVLASLLLSGAIACGDDDPPITAPGNQAPAISIATSATFGVAQLTTFTLNASVVDLDGNPVSVTWRFSDGTTGAGTTLWRTFSEPATIEVVATARDHLGASSESNTLTLTVGSMTGEWGGTMELDGCDAGTKPVAASLRQAGPAVTGTISLPEGLCSSTPVTASLGPSDPGRIFSGGAVRLQVNVPSLSLVFAGQMETSGQQIAGTLEGIEPSEMAFTLTRQ